MLHRIVDAVPGSRNLDEWPGRILPEMMQLQRLSVHIRSGKSTLLHCPQRAFVQVG
jgi:hypothetical protein